MKSNIQLIYSGFIILAFLFNANMLNSQPVANVKAPSHYSNPVVIMIPDKTPTVNLKGNKTSVVLYVVENNSGRTKNIVNGNSLAPGYKKYKADVHIRGDATANDPKKQFEVKIHHDKKNAGTFLGMKKEGKDWVFNDCGAVDMTLMRNVITFTMQFSLGQYAPQWKWFELFICDSSASIQNMSDILNNDYWGIYLNFDKIMFSPERINAPYVAKVSKKDIPFNYAIIQLNQADTIKYYRLPVNGSQPIALTAGVQLYEPRKKDVEEYNSTDSSTILNNVNNWYYTGSTSYDTNNWGGQMNNYYLNFILKTTDTNGRGNAIRNIRSITDYNSFAIYFLINEISKDPDGYHKSTFMVKNKNVCYAGPLWDKNKSYGNLANNNDTTFFYNRPEGWLFHDTANKINSNQCPVWWYVFLSDSVFCKSVWSIWKDKYRNGMVLRYATLESKIQRQFNYLNNPYTTSKGDTTSALIRNNQCWPNGYNQTMDLYLEQLQQLETYLKKRLAWMDNNLVALLSRSGMAIR
ncbi:MAG TPA: CotH kinase family protein [Flavobacteriales bacterium]|nr:CotH kinase family protein [Flavobacteriales bacterium]